MRQLQYLALYSFRSHSASFQSHFYISIHLAIHLWLALHCCFLFGHVSALFNVTCPNGWVESKVTGTCLKFFDSIKVWVDARKKCKQEGADLIRFDFDNFNTEVLEYLKYVKYDPEDYFIGLRLRTLRGIWAWLDEKEPAVYHNFTSLSRTFTCAYMNNRDTNGWGVVDCYVRKKFICQRPSQDGVMCPQGFVPNHFSGTCFKLITTPQTYEQSKRNCEEKGGELAMILDENTHNFVPSMIGTKPEDNGIYVGLDDLRKKGAFRWLGFRDPLAFTAWADGQPGNAGTKERCVVINTENPSERNVWNVVPCDKSAMSVCETYADCKMEKYGTFCPVNCSKTDCTIACNPRTGSCLDCLGPMCYEEDHPSPLNYTKRDHHNNYTKKKPIDNKNASVSNNIVVENASETNAPVKKADVSVFVVIGVAAFGTVVLGIIGATVQKTRKANVEKGKKEAQNSEQKEAKSDEEPVGEKQEDENLPKVDLEAA